MPPSQPAKGIPHFNDSLCRITTVSKRHLDARIMLSVLKLTSSGRIPINSLPLPLVDPTLCLNLHRKRNNIVVNFAVITWSDDLLPAHWTLGDAFAGLRTLIFASY